jgi:sterol desaturase/sphingolipid hydroxylase (fatty acid hydroxylase superfamily)
MLVSAALVGAALAVAPERAAVFGMVAVLALGIEGIAPRSSTHRTARAWVVDLTHAIGNRLPIISALQVLLTVTDPIVRAVRPDLLVRAYAAVPGWLALPLLLLVTDATNYAFHRLSHRWAPLWRLHRVHHSSRRLDWLATSRGHPLDQALAFMAVALPGMFVDAGVESGPVIVLLFVWPFLCHADVAWTGGRLDRLVVTPRFHHWHHAHDDDVFDRNFGALLTIWDRLFGTARFAADFPVRYGIGREGAVVGERYIEHLVSPWRRQAPAELWAPSDESSRGPVGSATDTP